jgi:hypothetical protein
VFQDETRAIVARLVAIASICGSPEMVVKAGTIRMPPPIPTTVESRPTARPIMKMGKSFPSLQVNLKSPQP